MYKSYNIRQQMQQIFYLKRPMKTFDRLRQLVSPWNERDYLSPSSLINKLKTPILILFQAMANEIVVGKSWFTNAECDNSNGIVLARVAAIFTRFCHETKQCNVLSSINVKRAPNDRFLGNICSELSRMPKICDTPRTAENVVAVCWPHSFGICVFCSAKNFVAFFIPVWILS